MDIRSYINILCNFGNHGYPKLHKYFMAIREYMDIRSYINILCNFGGTWISEVT